MASKFIALFALIAVASAQHYHNDYYQSNYAAAPAAVIKQVQPAYVKKVAYEHEAPANYEFQYDVHDPHTGDIKQQHEVAKEGAVSGEYSLIDADGYRRIVSYTADDHHGFVANVRREPVDGHKVVQPQIHKVIAQPVVQKVAVPQYYSAPAPVVQKVAVPQYYAPAPVAVKKVVSAPQYYSAPVVQKVAVPQYYSAPVVQKIAAPQYYSAPAPVVEKYVQSAPVVHKYVQAAPVIKTIQAAPVVKHVVSGENSAHVSVHAPGVNYHY